MQLVALRDWHPKYVGWTGTLVPESDRVGWVIHHTVGGTGQDPQSYARSVADYHYGKWRVPGGYNYLVGEDGLIRVMCGLSFRGVHSGTHEWNYKSLGLAFQGDFRQAPPSDPMLDAAAELIADTPIPSAQWGHRDVRPEPTTCPGGELYDLLPLEVKDMAFSKGLSADQWRNLYNLGIAGGASADAVAAYWTDPARTDEQHERASAELFETLAERQSGSVDSTARRIARSARDSINGLLDKLRRV